MKSLSNRFHAKVRILESGCHEWQGCITKNGYGQVGHKGKVCYAHRIAWLLAHGDPLKNYVLHRCDNRRCVNPEHLFLGTFQDNMDDMRSKQRHAFGSRNGQSKLTEAHVLKIRASGETLDALAQRYGVSPVTVWQAKTSKTWAHI